MLTITHDKVDTARGKACAHLNDLDMTGRQSTEEVLLVCPTGKAELWIRVPGCEPELALEGTKDSILSELESPITLRDETQHKNKMFTRRLP